MRSHSLPTAPSLRQVRQATASPVSKLLDDVIRTDMTEAEIVARAPPDFRAACRHSVEAWSLFKSHPKRLYTLLQACRTLSTTSAQRREVEGWVAYVDERLAPR